MPAVELGAFAKPEPLTYWRTVGPDSAPKVTGPARIDSSLGASQSEIPQASKPTTTHSLSPEDASVSEFPPPLASPRPRESSAASKVGIEALGVQGEVTPWQLVVAGGDPAPKHATPREDPAQRLT